MIKRIIFDFDETLVASKKILKIALKNTGKIYYGLEITDEKIEKYWGAPFKDFVRSLFDNKEHIDLMIKNYSQEVMKMGYDFYPGVTEGLNKLKSDYFLSIVSSSDSIIIRRFFKIKDFPESIFDFIQGAEDYQFHKPNPKVFDRIIEDSLKKGMSLSELVYIGDSKDDYEASLGAGINFVGLDHLGLGTFENLAQSVNNFEKLIETIKRI